MFQRILAVCLGLLWLATAPGSAQQATSVAEAEQGSLRVVAIMDAYDGRYLHSTGSGFVVAPNLVATNAHVAQPARQYSNIRLTVVLPNGDGPVPAEIVRFSAAQDLALLRFQGPSPTPLTISTVAPRTGDAIIALGYPDLDDIDRPAVELVRPTPPSRSTGSIAALRDRAPTGQPIPTINHEAAISSGSSGGPLIDECGRVVGVNTWHARGRDTMQGRGVATRSQELVTQLRAWGVEPRVASDTCLSAADRAIAERDAAVQALNAQSKEIGEISEKLAKADRLSRLATVAMIGGGIVLGAAIVVLGIVLFINRRRTPPSAAPAYAAAGVDLPPPRGATALPPTDAAIANDHITYPPAGGRRSALPVILVIAGAAAAAALILPVALPLLSDNSRRDAAAASVAAGLQQCDFDERASLSPNEDISFRIDENACVNGRTAYSPTTDGRAVQRVVLSERDRWVEVTTLSPETGELRRERFALDTTALQDATAAARAAPAPASCSPTAREQVARRNAALLRFAQGSPGERVIWRCQLQQQQ